MNRETRAAESINTLNPAVNLPLNIKMNLLVDIAYSMDLPCHFFLMSNIPIVRTKRTQPTPKHERPDIAISLRIFMRLARAWNRPGASSKGFGYLYLVGHH